MDKGSSLNSASLTLKPLASSVYVHVPEARCPHKRSISVMSLFPSRQAKFPKVLDLVHQGQVAGRFLRDSRAGCFLARSTAISLAAWPTADQQEPAHTKVRDCRHQSPQSTSERSCLSWLGVYRATVGKVQLRVTIDLQFLFLVGPESSLGPGRRSMVAILQVVPSR